MSAAIVVAVLLALALALCSAYLLGEYQGSKHYYEPLIPKAEEVRATPKREVTALLVPEIDPALVPIEVVTAGDMLATTETAIQQTKLAKRYRAEARRLKRNSK